MLANYVTAYPLKAKTFHNIKLRTMNIPGYERTYVCRETIYSAIYALPVGELRKELSSVFDKKKQRADPVQVVWIAAAKYLT